MTGILIRKWNDETLDQAFREMQDMNLVNTPGGEEISAEIARRAEIRICRLLRTHKDEGRSHEASWYEPRPMPIQVGISVNGEPVKTLGAAVAAVAEMNQLIMVEEMVDEGVFLAVLPLPLVERLTGAGWLRVESHNGVVVIEAEMP